MNDTIKEKLKNLFRFLKEFHSLKAKKKYDMESYEKVLWLHDIPKEKECFSIIQKMTTDTFNKDSCNFDKWIEIKKPKRNPCPKPPSEIMPWLKESENPENPPQLLSFVIKDSPSDLKERANEEKENARIFLEDRPEIKRIFENWLSQKWIPWAGEEKRLRAVSKPYNILYEIYKKNDVLGEVYQIILGLGLLSSKNRKGRPIERHIVTTPISIDFDSVSGAVSVGPYEHGAELSLETDMPLTESEKPGNCDEINNQLSDLSNDFWIKEEFYNQLRSWLNSYDSNGQFVKKFEKPATESWTTLSVSPAIILRKRNERDFIKFYASADQHIEEAPNLDHLPCLLNLIDEETTSPSVSEKSGEEKGRLHEKHYFPLPANEEQKKIIEKTETENQIVVQGPPGTGKTHSIANLICHFLAQGKRILVTSQTDRALKVLKNKLPEEIKPLCIEVLGRDQKSFQALKESFEVINSKYQNHDTKELLKKIERMEEKDNKIKGKSATVKARLVEIKNRETRIFEKFGYAGTPAVIASRLKEEEVEYRWIKEFFKPCDKDCPVSNNEAREFFILMKQIKNRPDDSVLEESMEWKDQIFTFQRFSVKIKEEKDIKNFLEKSAILSAKSTNYEKLKDGDLTQFKQKTSSLCLQTNNLLNRNEIWIKQALDDCLAARNGEWEYLYKEIEKILNANEESFKEAEKISKILTSESSLKTDRDLTNLTGGFFERYQPNDKIRWRWLCSKTVRKLKKIKIDGRPISSYTEACTLQKYINAKRASEKINRLQRNQGIDTRKTRNSFSGPDRWDKIRIFQIKPAYHIFKDFCKLLSECLSVHKTVEDLNGILRRNNISPPLWTPDSVKKESGAAMFASAKRALKALQDGFERAVSDLKPWRNQKNGMAEKFICALKNRNAEEYREALSQKHDFLKSKEIFDKICQIKKRLKNDAFYLKLKKEIDNPLWEKRLGRFEKAWAWQRADLWLEELTNEEFFQDLSGKMKDLSEKQKQNMERLVSCKAWRSCLSQIKHEELSSLKGLIHSISKIGKGTGKSAGRHRKTAKKRMEECKTAVPAWIMPLYRVVENLKPGREPFDIVIIDEASQTGPDGFLINYLAKKVIVVGDKEQISPEHPGIREEDVESLKKKYLSGIKFSEYIGRDYSYYDYCEILFTKSHVQLREHFRCMPEIIGFSNQISYTGTPLLPLRQYGSSRLSPLKRTFVSDAVSKTGNGRYPQNEKEAQAIVSQLKKCIQDPAYKGKTFGIISLQGQDQVKIIEKALLQIDKEEIEKRKIQAGDADDFQGDERDVMFLSMAVAKDWSVSALYALTKDTYKRRYNVAASRAKDQMHLFHSVDKDDLLNKEDYRRQLLDFFLSAEEGKQATVWPQDKLNELHKKIKETKNKSPENSPEPFDSRFEAKVFLKIAMKGYNVIPQYEAAGFFIDMIISGSKESLAVECDGDYWHDEEREGKDLERQLRLERCGWTFWRVRESAFNRNPCAALKSLWKKLEEMQIFPLGKDDESSS